MTYSNRKIWMLLLVALLLAPVFTLAVQSDQPKAEVAQQDQRKAAPKITVRELLDKYAETQNKLRSFVIKSESQVDIDLYSRRDYSHLNGKNKKYYSQEFRYDGNRCKICRHRWGDDFQGSGWENIPRDTAFYSSKLWDGEQYIWNAIARDRDASWDGVRIDKRKDERFERKIKSLTTGTVDRGCYIRGYFLDNTQRIDTVLRQANNSSVRRQMEMAGGSNCYVIDAETENDIYTLWIDPQHGYNVVQAKLQQNKKGTWGSFKTSFSLKEVRFEKVNDVWIPMEAVTDWNKVISNGDYQRSICHYKRTEIKLNPDHDALGSFLPDDIRNGAEVRILGQTIKYEWQDGKAVDEQGNTVWEYKYKIPQKAETIIDPNKPQLTVELRKPLPSLALFNLKLDPDKTKGKRMLVLFWDMNQRPSRHCITELAKKAPELAKQNVTIVAVQIPKVYEKSFKIWLEYNKIPFPVGMIGDDEKKIKTDWNVQSLPWLILTDKDHVVQAQGFGLNELDEKIKGNNE